MADRLSHIGAISAGLAGVLEIAAQIIPYVPDNAGLETLYGAIDVSFLVALVAVIAETGRRLSWPGLILLLIAIAGVASIVGPDKTAFGIDFYRAGSAVFVLALGAASVWMVRLPGYRRPAMAWLAASALALVAGATGESMLFRMTSFALAIGFLLLAPTLWQSEATD